MVKMEITGMDTPLQLDDYFFPHIRVSADPDAGGEDDYSNGDFRIGVSAAKREEENEYQVAIHISLTPQSEDKKATYIVELVAIGFFQVHPDFPDPKKLLEVNGASILYASAREFLITITSRSLWGALKLPTTSFLRMYEEKQAESKEEDKDSSADKLSE